MNIEIEKFEKLSYSNKELRENVKRFMEFWSNNTPCGERIISNTEAAKDETYYYYLTSGSKEFTHLNNYGEIFYYGIHALSINELREFLKNLPTMIQEITQKAKDKNNENIDFLNMLKIILKEK